MGKPWWRSTIEQVDMWVEPHVSGAVHHEGFARAVGMVYRLRHAVASESEKASALVLHTLNLPTRADVSRLVADVADLERTLRGIRDELRDSDTGAG